MSRDLRVWQVQRDGPRTLGAVLEALEELGMVVCEDGAYRLQG